MATDATAYPPNLHQFLRLESLQHRQGASHCLLLTPAGMNSLYPQGGRSSSLGSFHESFEGRHCQELQQQHLR